MSKDAVYQFLKTKSTALKLAEIVQQTGIDKKDVDNAIKALKAEGKIFSPKNCYYQAK